jgi:casein kinase I family protein HRR25
MLVYFMRGRLPWQGLKATSGEARYRRILEMKQTTSMNELCAGLPTEFVDYVEYVRILLDDDITDYGYLRKMFNNLFPPTRIRVR